MCVNAVRDLNRKVATLYLTKLSTAVVGLLKGALSWLERGQKEDKHRREELSQLFWRDKNETCWVFYCLFIPLEQMLRSRRLPYEG